MIRKISSVIITVLFIMAIANVSNAQIKVTFRINLKKELKDSVFVPPSQTIEVSGDVRPFTRTRTFRMEDKPPIDSIYVCEVRFPRSVMGSTLKYNFVIKKEYETIKERQPRLLAIRDGDRVLDIAFFNDFAW